MSEPKALTCLRYPGGKSKVIKKLLFPLFPTAFDDFYEPFIGGASVALFVAQIYQDKKIFVNDLNDKLTNFHNMVKKFPVELSNELHFVRKKYDPSDIDQGKDLLSVSEKVLYSEKSSELDKAIAYYVLNKISFSGMTEHSSISKAAYAKTFNHKNIDNILEVSNHMKNFEIFNQHFKDFMDLPKENDFTFLDPPYQIESSNLYGKKGEMHTGFDHEEFAQKVFNLKGKWFITYNDNPWIREKYKDYNIQDAEYRYCMSFEKDEEGNKKTRIKNELIITNY